MSEQVKAEWPAVTMVRFSKRVRKGNTEPAIHRVWPTAEPDHWDLPGYELRRYVPEGAPHFTQLVEGLEAEIDRLKGLGEKNMARCHFEQAARLEALLDQHKKEGRS